MATIKVKIRVLDSGKTEGKILYQIIHNRTVRRISSGLFIPLKNWDQQSGSIVGELTHELKHTEMMMKRHVEMLRRIIMTMEKQGDYSADDIVEEFEKIGDAVALSEVAKAEIQKKRKLGKHRTADAYYQSVRRFIEFFCGHDVSLYEINSDVVEDFQSWLFGKGLVGNSVSFYMRNLRCLYNRAVRRGLVDDAKPFKSAYTGIAKTRKRAIRETDLKKISMLDLSDRSGIERSRDYFLLSFYCMGMSFVDMAYLKKSALKDGRITYRRSKTGQTISFSMNSKISRLVKKYASAPNSPYLLDIIDTGKGDGRKQYKNAIGRINRHLKTVGRLAGIKIPLTSYVSRHTWASIAKMKNVGISTISDALGHENESTTHIYLSLLDTSHIDRANNLVIKDI